MIVKFATLLVTPALAMPPTVSYHAAIDVLAVLPITQRVQHVLETASLHHSANALAATMMMMFPPTACSVMLAVLLVI